MKLYSLGGGCCVVKLKKVMIMIDCPLSLSSLLHFLPNEQKPTLSFTLNQSTSSSSQSNVLSPQSPQLRFPLRTSSQSDGTSKATEAEPNSSSPFVQIGSKLFIDSKVKFKIPERDFLDLRNIDVILITNHLNLLALPFITEHTSFKGRIYATEPTIHIGTQFMYELCEYYSTSFMKDVSNWQKPELLSALPLSMAEELKHATKWRELYNKQDIDSCVSKIKSLSYDQHIDIFSLLRVTPMSSGFAIGAANWEIKTSHEKVVFMADSSSASARHPEAMNVNGLKDCDVLILTKLTPEPMISPDSMLSELLSHIGLTVSSGGNVIIPINPSGILLDLLEQTHTYLMGLGFGYVPMYFVSPVAEYLLQYSNILGEWLCKPKQEKLFLPEDPFNHAELIKNNHLAYFSHPSDPKFATSHKSPCIVFTGHPSLRFGPVTHWIRMWGSESKNCIIFTDTDYDYLSCIAPFQTDLQMKVFYSPIDPRLNFGEANVLIKEMKPKHVVIPEHYATPPLSGGTMRNMIVPTDGPITTFKEVDVVSIPLRRRFERAVLSKELALNLHPKKIGDTSMVSMYGLLDTRDNQIKLDIASLNDSRQLEMQKKRYLWGTLTADKIIEALEERGVGDIQVTNDKDDPHTIILNLPSLNSSIILSPNETVINTDTDTKRQMLKEIVISYLNIS